jgi:hypothetical protein
MGGPPVFVVEQDDSVEIMPAATPSVTKTATATGGATAVTTPANAQPSDEVVTETAVVSPVPTAPLLLAEEIEVETTVTPNHLSGWYFLGSGLLLGLGLLFIWRRRL